MAEKQFVKLKVYKTPVVGEGMVGFVINHPFHSPGTEVGTTKVLSIEGNRVETRGSIYEVVLAHNPEPMNA